MTARMNFLAQDRSDIQHAVKELSKEMSKPNQASWIRLKRLVRYLKGAPRYRTQYQYQAKPDQLTTWADSDFVGCKLSRKSTSAGVIMHGSHVIKSWSSNQAVIALSSGEAEYYSLVKAASMSIGLRSISVDLGVSFGLPIVLKSDASAAIGIANRLGLGKIRHIETNQLWLQSKVNSKDLMIEKVGADENLSDALTKPVDTKTMQYHIAGIAGEVREDRHPLAPIIDEDQNVREEIIQNAPPV